MSHLVEKSACELVDMLARREVSACETLDVLEARIGAVDAMVNALPTLCFERAREHAQKVDAQKGDSVMQSGRGVLMGLPVAIKDLSNVAGVLSTQGSPIFADYVPIESDDVVRIIEEADGVIYAKSNTPEFGAGGNTFNEVFGATCNPWDVTRSAAGSSGGAAVALATGMAWLAQGSDMGGSLRNPASFCGVVGMRPSPGRVPRTPASDPADLLAVNGPMARCVADIGLFMDALARFEPRDPISFADNRFSYRYAAQQPTMPQRIAYSPNLGITPVDPEIATITQNAARYFEQAGVIVEEAHPDLSEAHEVFHILRAAQFAISMGELLREHRNKLKPEVIWNIEQGLQLAPEKIYWAQRQRGVLIRRAAAFFKTYDLLLTPATITAAYPIDQRYVAQCDGVEFENYVQWLGIAYAITLTALPALSLPCGFTASGLPVGMQIVGPPRGELSLLQGAAALEDMLNVPKTPINPKRHSPN